MCGGANGSVTWLKSCHRDVSEWHSRTVLCLAFSSPVAKQAHSGRITEKSRSRSEKAGRKPSHRTNSGATGACFQKPAKPDLLNQRQRPVAVIAN
jgi:hypothetical protein